MSARKASAIISLSAFVLSILIIYFQGINFGLEFTGGTQVELRFDEPVEVTQIRQKLEKLNFQDLRVQNYGSSKDILIRLANKEGDELELKNKIISFFKAEGVLVDARRVDYVGSEVGSQLAQQGSMAVLAAILATMVYIALRFEYRFAISAALALVHDAVIVLGVFSLFKIEFDLATLASVLAVIGYSLNDTIVVFDRVRENLRKVRKENTSYVVNLSINQTLSRTIMTSFLTLLVVVALLMFGGETLFGFSLALLLGILIGTYSSIYVAGNLALSFGLSREDLLPKPKAEIDDLP